MMIRRAPLPKQVFDDPAPSAAERANERWGCSHSEHNWGPGGSSNSHPADRNCPKPRTPPLPRAGIDTVSWGWSDTSAVDRLLRLDGTVLPGDDRRPLRVLPAALGAVRLSRRIDGLGTVGAYPGASMLFVEGRARALELADEKNHGLAAPGALRFVQDQVTEGLGKLLGRRLAAPGGLRRADLTGELEWDRPEDGREFLQLLSGMHSPRHKVETVMELGAGGMETVTWKTPKRFATVMRAYDKGVESGSAPAGERIRLERQLRFKSGKRPTVEQWLSRDLGDLYTAPVRAWLKDGLAAGTAAEMLELLTDAGEIWPKYWASGSSWASRTGTVHCSLWGVLKIERIAGDLALMARYGGSWPLWSPKQRQRRLRAARELGLLVTDRPVSVDMDQAIGSLCELWRAAA